MPLFEVELSWRASETFVVEAPDENAACEAAITQARRAHEPDEYDVEAVAEVE